MKFYQKINLFALFLLVFTMTISCTKTTENTPDPIDDSGLYKFAAPSNFPATSYNFANNSISKEGFLLGKKIFFDPQFSSDGTVSCGTCHKQFSAFADFGHTLSHGVENRLGTRNAPPLMNMAWQSEFFWDGGVNDLDKVPINAFTAHFEMNETMSHILYKINKDADYRKRFKMVFNVDSAATPQLLKALSQFMLLMVSGNSKYDKYKRGEAGGNLTADELAGMQLFQEKCTACHKTDLFTDRSYRNNGMTILNPQDKGRQKITLNAADEYKFRVPSLRNLSYTAPYMHNGSIATLEQVVDRYQSGVRMSPTLDSVMMERGNIGILLSTDEKAKIVAFLKTLDDDDFVKQAKFR